MKKVLSFLSLFLIVSMLMSSCVAKKKYISARTRASEMKNENMVLSDRIVSLQDTISRMHHRLGALGNANENTANELSKTSNELNRTSNELNMTKDQVEAQRQRLQQLQAFIDQQQKSSENLRKSIADALIGFTPNELMVTIKDGRVYISMQEALLFPSGSAKVNPRGKEALAIVASVLNKNTDVSIDIEGHTDNVPIHTAQYPDNWALSTARATSIAHVLIDEYTVSPVKLTASGRGQYNPVADNGTPAGRQQNRRTEIILQPRYDELMSLMNPATVKK